MKYKMKKIMAILGLFSAVLSARLGWSQELMISAGGEHTCAILETGEAKCWGTPIPVDKNLITPPFDLEHAKWRAISAGSEHICGVLESGEAKCWGKPDDGRITLPSSFEHAKWKAISAGGDHTCGILESGEAKCWGSYKGGQTTLPKGLENAKWKTISAGHVHTCAILENGEAKCWGYSDNAQTTLPKGLENAKWKTISAGYAHTCAILESGEAKCWGDSIFHWGTLLPEGLESVKWGAISAGGAHTCAILESGEAKCWGKPDDGRTTLPPSFEHAKWKTISAGSWHTCGILANGEAIHCWGKNEYGQAPAAIRLLPEYPFGISNLELGLEKLMAVVSPVKKAFLERILKILNPLKKPENELSRINLASLKTNLSALNQRIFLLNALGPFMEDLSSAYEKEHVVTKYLKAREQANIENEIKCLADLDCNASLKLLSLELIQSVVEALKGQTASNEDHALMENLTTALGQENLSQVMNIFDSAPGKKLFGAFAQSPFTRGFGLMIQSLAEYLRGAR